MLNEDKIRLMTRLSIYEEKTGKEDLKINDYYHFDYVGMKVRKAVVSVTLSYVLILAMTGFYYMEELLASLIGMDYKSLGIKVLTIYLIIVAVYVVLVIIATQIQTKNAKKRMNVFMKDFRHLRKYYGRMEENE